jgi:NAD(P)-dependent dehydrogenase (short-subunit alcohol dehydrogenase family)
MPKKGDAEMIAVVTGTCGQLGPIWCETLEEMGYKIFGIDLPDHDITDSDQMNIDAHSCIMYHGIPSVLVLNAAIDSPPQSKATFFGDFERITEVNQTGAINVLRAFLPSMIQNGGGTVVLITSIQGYIGADKRNYIGDFAKPVAYNMSKAAYLQLARSITTQYGDSNIRACCIGFGPYDGGKLDPVFLNKFLKNVPLGRPVSRQSLKAALRFAIDCPGFAGQGVLIDGGYVAW